MISCSGMTPLLKSNLNSVFRSFSLSEVVKSSSSLWALDETLMLVF